MLSSKEIYKVVASPSSKVYDRKVTVTFAKAHQSQSAQAAHKTNLLSPLIAQLEEVGA